MSRKLAPDRQARKPVPIDNNDTFNSGLVVASYGAKVDVEDETGSVYRCSLRRKFGAIVCGDRVSWQPGHDNAGIITELFPRHTLLARPDDIGRVKPIAANISQIIIVCTVKALPNENYYLHHNLVDCYLVAAENLNITPVIIINKTDLLNDVERTQLENEMQPYNAIGYKLVHTSTKLDHGLEQLRQQLQDQTSIFVGESGVGKSSLINSLLDNHDIRVGDVSASSGKGKHTTTSTRLYHLSSGGDLIDSPGVREFGLSKIEPEALAYSFIEFRDFIQQCKFHNCIHNAEPHCGVKQAVNDNKISQRRYDNYLVILSSLQQQQANIYQ